MSLPRSNSSYSNAWAKINKYFTFPIYHTNDVAEEWKDVSCDLQRWAMSMLKGIGIDTEIYGMKSSTEIDWSYELNWMMAFCSITCSLATCWMLKIETFSLSWIIILNAESFMRIMNSSFCFTRIFQIIAAKKLLHLRDYMISYVCVSAGVLIIYSAKNV